MVLEELKKSMVGELSWKSWKVMLDEVKKKVHGHLPRGSKFPEIDVFADVYVRPRDELAESLHVQDTSQPTLTRGLEARVLRLDGLLMNPPTTSKQTFAPWKSPGKTFVNKNQNSSLKKT
ncbi:hypothetical protein C1H46_037895 [Malus baccata]|uniref:Uncharacterized protein n=1 Tax=Malus baccata TaxID=106549 RepID=A0A540KQR1_MALBA|nr:hypothetical protein C1H46_037895 [Malus baccata]